MSGLQWETRQDKSVHPDWVANWQPNLQKNKQVTHIFLQPGKATCTDPVIYRMKNTLDSITIRLTVPVWSRYHSRLDNRLNLVQTHYQRIL